MRSDNYSIDFISDFLSECDAIFIEVLENRHLILVVAIGVKMDFVFVVRLLCAFGNNAVKFVACFLYPFADAKCRPELCVAFYVEVAVCVARFRVTEERFFTPCLFFFINVQSSSIS